MNDNPENCAPTDIAIVGMAGKFPGAATVDEFWRNLRDGRESIVALTDEQLIAAGESPALLADPAYVRFAAVLEGFDTFDAEFFGLSPKEAAMMDPQHRLLLECATEALENAGYDPERFPGAVGVFAGCGMNAYFMFNLLANRKLMNSTGMFLVRHTGNDKDFLSTRISYTLNLRGPSINVQTACSTSLVAVHLACQSLINGETDMALAGGVTIELPHARGYVCQEGEILSEDGHCRAFDAAATGTIFGSGGGIVVLRRLSDALENGDTIHAVIKATAVNNDGAGKVGYLAPSVDGQAAAVAEAIGMSGVPAESITYIEAHGTGTRVGDPIEVQALTQAFRRFTDSSGFCGIGSVKSNIGHLDTAAGIASVIKTVQALKNRQLPPTLHYRTPNPLLDLPSTPFYVNGQLRDWPTTGEPRRAGVNSLGVGGTNAHAIIEEPPVQAQSSTPHRAELLTVSARTETALARALTQLGSHLETASESALADTAFTLQSGRRPYAWRAAVVCDSTADAGKVLSSPDSKRIVRNKVGAKPPSVAFLFPGGGAQYPGMGADLYREHKPYREIVDECLEIAKAELGTDLRPILYPDDAGRAQAQKAMEKPTTGLVALFITEVAIAKLWRSLGVEPKVLLGHSVGEYPAACIAGVMSIADGLRAVRLRGQLLETAGAGAMLSVQMTEAELRAELDGELSVAAINGPTALVASGSVAAIDRLQERLTKKQIDCTRLRISTAAHSPLLEPVLAEFRAMLASFPLHAPEIPMITSLTGRPLSAAEATSPDFWVRQFRESVRFADAVQAAAVDSPWFLEAGPGVTLTSLVKLQPADKIGKPVTLASLPHPQDTASAWQPFLNSVGRLWTAGLDIAWDALYDQRRRRVPLPTYPFERRRYWIDPDAPTASHATAGSPAERPSSDDPHFYEPVWRSATAPAAKAVDGHCLIFAEPQQPLADHIRHALEARGVSVTTVLPGEKFERLGDRRYSVGAAQQTDYELLFADLAERSMLPVEILHLWSAPARSADPRRVIDYSFHSLVLIARTLTELQSDRVNMRVVSTNLYPVGERGSASPERAILLGPCRVIPTEYPNVACQSIDFDLSSNSVDECARRIVDEVGASATDRVVSYRPARHVLSYAAPIATASRDLPWKTKGVYLITGGLSGIALALGQSLAKRFSAKLAIVARTKVPARSEWDAWLASNGAEHPVSVAIGNIRKLEAAGATVLPLSADVADHEQMRGALSRVRSEFGRIDGVVHAAGVLNDGVIQFKDAESFERVLRPKLGGTLVLGELLANDKLDFCVLFSSTSALLGLAGQVDYAAANSFLDVFAASEAGRKLNAISVNWGIWKELGMTARLLAPPMLSPASQHPAGNDNAAVIHPLLGQVFMRGANHTVYSARHKAGGLWTLDEHRTLAGNAILPGSAYLEMLRAAVHNLEPGSQITIRDLQFIAPLHAGNDEAVAIRVSVKKEADVYSAVVTSESPGSPAEEHALGNVSVEPVTPPQRVDLAALHAACGNEVHETTTAQFLRNQVARLRFGARWDVLRSVRLGADSLVARLELPQSYTSDLAEYQIHPAVLDIATGAGLPLLEGYAEDKGVFVPVAYGRATLYRPFAQTVCSHVRRTDGRGDAKGLATFDVTIFDESGDVIMEISDFTVRRVDGDAMEPPRSAARPAASETLLRLIERGLGTEQGIRALDAVLCRRGASQIAVTTVPLEELMSAAHPNAEPSRRVAHAEGAGGESAARDEIESFLIDLWSDLLGVDNVGLEDDFFELGGHSLIAVRLFSRIKKKFHKEFGLATLFQARTVEKQAALIRGTEAKPAHRFSALVPIRDSGSRHPLFLVAGMGGNVVGFNPLVRHLSADIPVYGLQSLGMDGSEAVLTRVEDMAARYLTEIRLVQPSGPYHLCGYSFGGLVAYEMAQQLQAASEQVAFVGLLDTYQQNYLNTLPKPGLSERMGEYLRKASKHASAVVIGPNRWDYVRSRFELFYVNIAKNYLYKLYLKTGRPLPRTNETVRYINPIAGANYIPKPMDGRLTLFRAAIREPGERFDYNLGWSGLASGGLDVIEIPGRHIEIGEEPNVRTLARRIEDCMTETRAMAASQSQGK